MVSAGRVDMWTSSQSSKEAGMEALEGLQQIEPVWWSSGRQGLPLPQDSITGWYSMHYQLNDGELENHWRQNKL
jgi:hypothetical protein